MNDCLHTARAADREQAPDVVSIVVERGLPSGWQRLIDVDSTPPARRAEACNNERLVRALLVGVIRSAVGESSNVLGALSP